jgi:hypothetical protein
MVGLCANSGDVVFSKPLSQFHMRAQPIFVYLGSSLFWYFLGSPVLEPSSLKGVLKRSVQALTCLLVNEIQL